LLLVGEVVAALGGLPSSSWDSSWLLALLLLGQVLELQASITMVGSVGFLVVVR
jgi:hypothetical protein